MRDDSIDSGQSPFEDDRTGLFDRKAAEAAHARKTFRLPLTAPDETVVDRPALPPLGVAADLAPPPPAPMSFPIPAFGPAVTAPLAASDLARGSAPLIVALDSGPAFVLPAAPGDDAVPRLTRTFGAWLRGVAIMTAVAAAVAGAAVVVQATFMGEELEQLLPEVAAEKKASAAAHHPAVLALEEPLVTGLPAQAAEERVAPEPVVAEPAAAAAAVAVADPAPAEPVAVPAVVVSAPERAVERPAPRPRRAAPAPAPAPAPKKERRAASVAGEGKLTIDAVPYATIYVDGKRLGDTPILGHELGAGNHRIRAISASGGIQEISITVEPGGHVRRRIVF